ncbi:flagellar motor switch protein FliN [Desulfovibrio sp. OttesenSCG-928-M16]|nr:flagellar motor switch protein FliN [Desulfovibrio sp. OttesenSCG-928-M16]
MISNEDIDQEALAAQWAASLGEDDDDDAPGDAPAADAGAGMSEEEALAAEWAAALAADEQESVKKEKEQHVLSAQAKVVEFKDMTDEAKAPRQDSRRELDFILDIPLDVSAELGRTRLLINELLQLGQGSVVELNKLAGEPLEVYVNGKMVARGEAVVINEKFGIRLTDIISPIERVKQLG